MIIIAINWALSICQHGKLSTWMPTGASLFEQWYSYCRGSKYTFTQRTVPSWTLASRKLRNKSLLCSFVCLMFLCSWRRDCSTNKHKALYCMKPPGVGSFLHFSSLQSRKSLHSGIWCRVQFTLLLIRCNSMFQKLFKIHFLVILGCMKTDTKCRGLHLVVVCTRTMDHFQRDPFKVGAHNEKYLQAHFGDFNYLFNFKLSKKATRILFVS